MSGLASRSDDELCRAFLDGEDRAFGELVRRYQEPLYRIVRRYCAPPEDAMDLAQRAFLQAFEAARRSLFRLGQEGVPFRPWLFRIAVNLGKNHARTERRRRAGLTVASPEASGVTPAEELERAERARRLRAAILELPRRQREVLTLRLDAGLSFADVAETLGIQENNAKVHFHHAVRRLRELLGDPAEEIR